jgi:Domain of unknown function (DUF4417)
VAPHTRPPVWDLVVAPVVNPPPLRLEYREPADLLSAENPRNWKFHPPDQIESIDSLYGQVGFAGALLLNERTGKLLDGHARRGLFAAKASGPVPVLVGSWTEEQESLILAYLDPTGWTAVADRKKLDALLAGGFPPLKTAAMADLTAALRRSARLLDPADDAETKDEEDLEITVPLDSMWATDNPQSVPALDPRLQADQVPHPVQTWGTIGARREMRGTWHFFVHDHKFEPLWRRPYRVLWSRPACAVEPNFSTTDQTPFAQALWHIYRKRWLARYWQANGLRIFVDLNVDGSLNKPHEAAGGLRPNLLGVPVGWKAYASRAHGNQPERLTEEWEVAREHSGDERPLFLVVGGGGRVKHLAQQHGWVWVPEQIQRAHGTEGETTDGE